MPLSNSEISFYKKNGFIGPCEIISEQEMKKKSDKIVKEIFTPSAKSKRLFGYHSLRDVHLWSKKVYDIATHPVLIGKLRSLLGKNILLWRSTVFNKSAKGNNNEHSFSEIIWHQGLDFMKPTANKFEEAHPAIGYSRKSNLKSMPHCITVWFALDTVYPQSGPVVFAPGSHKKGPQFYRIAKKDETDFHGLGFVPNYEKIVDERKSIPIPTPAGSCIIFHNLTFHKSDANKSKFRRAGIAFRYVSADVPVYYDGISTEAPLDNWGCILVSGKKTRVPNKIIQPW